MRKKSTSIFIEKLKTLAESSDNSIEKAVAIEALEAGDTEDILNFFSDLLQYGCISGMVSSLIYYTDTEVFFDTHYHQIMEIKTQYEQSTGQLMEIPYHLKNHLAWFAFEQVAQELWEAL